MRKWDSVPCFRCQAGAEVCVHAHAVPAQMVQYGFGVNTGDYDNRTALMLAVVGNHAAAVNTLLGAGADANVQVRALHPHAPADGPPLFAGCPRT